MKKLILSAFIASTLMAPAFAETPNLKAGTFGLGVPINGDDTVITGKYLLSDGLAVSADLGFAVTDDDRPGRDGDTEIIIGAGLRKYLKMADVAPFVGARFQVGSSDANDTFLVVAEAGAEAFLLKNFSIEGAVGFGYRSNESGGVKQSSFGTTTFQAKLNYYF